MSSDYADRMKPDPSFKDFKYDASMSKFGDSSPSPSIGTPGKLILTPGRSASFKSPVVGH